MPESVEPSPAAQRRELVRLSAAWLVLIVVAVLLARQDLLVPGLY